jgi:serine/threonine protein kinase
MAQVRESGKPFGNYMLLERLARGGMAEVFLARQQGPQGFDRLVALKRILPHLMDSEDFVRMFHDEARLAARLSHPNVVHIYEFGKVDEHHFIAMEFVDGVHAGAIIEFGAMEPVPPALVARIAADACAGLNHAHRLTDASGNPLHLVHRDISPPNLMISYDGVVKLVDFGIAKAVDMAGKTMPGIVKGKYAYMSPEQTMGKKLDGRSDVFSLGMIIWEMLAGRVALERTDPVEAMRCIRDGRLPNIRVARPDVPPVLADILDMALANKPAERPSAAELGSAFEGFIKSWPELATSMQVAAWVESRFPRKLGGGQEKSDTISMPVPEPGYEQRREPVSQHGESNPAPRSFLDDDDDDVTRQASAASMSLLPRAHGHQVGQVPGPMPPHTPVPAPFSAPSYPGAGRLVSAMPARGSFTRRHRIIVVAVLAAVVIGVIMLSVGSGGDSGSSSTANTDAGADAGDAGLMHESDAAAGSGFDDAGPGSEADAGPGSEARTAGDQDESAWLVIEAEPEGATVTLDSREPTPAPAFFDKLAASSHDLAIEHPGYVDIEETVKLGPGQNKLSYVLQRSKRRRGKGKLAVFTRPSCTAYLNNKKLGRTPFAGKKLDEGLYTVTCQQSGYKTAKQRVRIRSGKTTKVKLDLQEK